MQTPLSSSSATNRFTGKIAIITGSGRGLGAATALRLANEGADIVVNDISSEAAREMASVIEKIGRRVLMSTHDVSLTSEANALVDSAMKAFGKIDVLVNNAGITRDGMLHKLTEEKFDEVIRVNLKGPFNMGQACAKVMMEKKYGKIVNLASIAWLGNIGQTNYSASKAGLVGMTRTWALELSRYQINVNAVAPGLINTQMTQAIPAEVKEKFIAKIPLRRMGNPEDIAAVIAFLASDEANYITGQCIQVDGGLTTGSAGT
ncbi:MAG: 3-oxoacyl-ACP reductase FabG [Cryobacterium sp.]|nr:3-oxoacyl-ACP reductase FabG [Oligoflexia bacterium]